MPKRPPLLSPIPDPKPWGGYFKVKAKDLKDWFKEETVDNTEPDDNGHDSPFQSKPEPMPHINKDDSWATAWAESLKQAGEDTAPIGVKSVCANPDGVKISDEMVKQMGEKGYSTHRQDGTVIPDTPEGVRDDGGKLGWHLVPKPGMLAFVKVWAAGACKYAPDNWRKGMEWHRIYRPMESHLNKWLMSKSSYDKELGTHHLMMVAWGCFVLYMYEIVLKNGERFDDRPDKNLYDDEEFEYHLPLVDEPVKYNVNFDRDKWLREMVQWSEEEATPDGH